MSFFSACQIRELIDSYTGTRYNLFMIRSFRHRGLRRLFERDDPRRIAADKLDRITLALADLDAADRPCDLDVPGYRLHPLRVDLRGCGASRLRATGGSPLGLKLETCTTLISSITTSEE